MNCFTFSGLTRPLMFLALGTSEAPQYRPGGTLYFEPGGVFVERKCENAGVEGGRK